MNKLKCIIADDEPIARQILEGYISDTPHLTLVSSCKDAFEVMEVLQHQTVDILFLDINMPKISGFSLLKALQQKPSVVVTTAYAEYAVEGFNLSVTDYLLKPFSLERFIEAVIKVQNQHRKPVTEAMVDSKPDSENIIFVKSDKKIIKLDYDTIVYIQAYGNYIKIYTDQVILTPQTLSNFIEKLPENFIRIHKSYAMNFKHLRLIDGNQIILTNNVKVPIGKSYRKAVLDKIE